MSEPVKSKRPAARVLAAVGREAWAIQPEALEVMLDIAGRTLEAPGVDLEAIMRQPGEPLEGASWRAEIRSGVAVIAVRGPIIPRADMFAAICGATSVERLAMDIAAAVDSPDVRAVVLDVDSPGGAVTGINELAGQIAAAREIKPVVAYVSGMAASAAYWLASAASEIVADRTAELGSIGVVAAYTDRTKQDEAAGIRSVEIVSSQSPKKRLSPTTKEGRAEIQARIDGLADVFVENVARNRGKSTDTVLETFGQGGVMLAQAAVAVGMADRLGSLEGVISEYAGGAGRITGTAPQALEADMPEDKTKEALTAEAVNAAWLAAHKPDLVASIKAEAAAAERGRIGAIMDLGIKGHDALVRKALIEEPMTAEALALSVIKAEAGTREAVKAAIENDAAQIVVPAAPPATEEAEEAKWAQLEAAGVAAMNEGR